MSVRGVGIDLIELARVRDTLARHGARFLEKVLSEEERAYVAGLPDPVPHVAARIAAKEAAFKALQAARLASPVSWLQVAVRRDDAGRPTLVVPEADAAGLRLHLSLTHGELVAAAVVIAEG